MSPAAFELIREAAFGRGEDAGYDFALQRNRLTPSKIEIHAIRYAGMVQLPPEFLTEAQRLRWFQLSREGFRFGAEHAKMARWVIPMSVYVILSSQ
jgi:hypothetical protein